MNFFFSSQGYKKPKKFIATQGKVLGYQVSTITLYGHRDVVLVYLVVGIYIVETVTDQLETHLLLLLATMRV